MIKVPSYLDFFAKLVSYLGIDFDEEKYAKNELRKSDKKNKEIEKSNKSDKENKINEESEDSDEDCRITNKFRIKERKEFNSQVELYNKDYLPKIIDLLSGGDKDNKREITHFLNIIESLMRYLIDKNYYTIASNKRAMWGLFIFYYIPQFACMLSLYKNECNIPKHLIDNGFMLPIFESNKIITPTDRLKKYLKENVKKVILKDKYSFNNFTDNFLAKSRSIKSSNITPRHKTKFEIINELKENSRDKDSPIIHEIESIFTCAIFTSNIYQELRKYFKNDNYVKSLIEYFRECFDSCNKCYGAIGVDISSIFKEFINIHMFLFAIELNHVRKLYLEWIEKLRNKYRGYLFHIFNLYLRGTINSEINVFENINTNNFCKGVFRYTSDHITQYTDIEHNKIISFLEELERIFANPENELNEESINNIFKQIKDHKYFENYKHELLYYEGLNYLAKNEFSEAIEKLQIVCKKW